MELRGGTERKKAEDNMEQIDNFTTYFKEQIEVVSNLSCASNATNAALYKKLVYVALLDCFSALRFNDDIFPLLHKKNNERFTKFLAEYAGWDVGCLVSVVFLNDKLNKKGSKGELAQYVEQEMRKLGGDFPDTICAKDVDARIEYLLTLASTEEEEKDILSCQHYSILYRYRNNLVHQARQAGNAAEFMEHDKYEACYFKYVKDPSACLLYPLGLFKRLCLTSLDNLKKYFEKNRIDPYKIEDDPRYF